MDWTYRWSDIVTVSVNERGVEIVIGEKNKKMLGLFGSNEQHKKLILVEAKSKREKLWSIMDRLKNMS